MFLGWLNKNLNLRNKEMVMSWVSFSKTTSLCSLVYKINLKTWRLLLSVRKHIFLPESLLMNSLNTSLVYSCTACTVSDHIIDPWKIRWSDAVIDFKLAVPWNKHILMGRTNLTLVKLWAKIPFTWWGCLSRSVSKSPGIKSNPVWLSLNMKGSKHHYAAT